MKPRREKATKSEQMRYAALKSIGCIVSRKFYNRWEPCEIHHLTSGGRRLGNEFTIPLSSWRHRAIIPQDCKTTSEAIQKYGPSLETSKRDFVERFGSELDLLKETNRYLGIRSVVDGNCEICDG